MGINNWFAKRKFDKDKKKRQSTLSDEDIQTLNDLERRAYLSVAKHQIIKRGRVNALKDFPVDIDKDTMKSLEEIKVLIERDIGKKKDKEVKNGNN